MELALNFLLFFSVIYCDTSEPDLYHTDDDYSGFTTEAVSTQAATTTTVAYFSDMPEAIKIVYIEAESLIKFDNKGEKMMGVSDEKCDNGKVNLSPTRHLNRRSMCVTFPGESGDRFRSIERNRNRTLHEMLRERTVDAKKRNRADPDNHGRAAAICSNTQVHAHQNQIRGANTVVGSTPAVVGALR